MIGKDRALLARMVRVNTAMGEVLMGMLARQDAGQLNAKDLVNVGRQLLLLGADMVRRADELGRTVNHDELG